MSFPGFFITLVLVGSIQGFIISSLLFFSTHRKLSSRLLGSLIFLIALASLNIFLSAQPWFVSNVPLQIFHTLMPWVMAMPMGPLIYFYVRSFEPGFVFSKKDKRHFYPLVLDILPQVIVLLFMVATAFGLSKSNGPAVGAFIDIYNVYADIPRWLSMSLYIGLTYTYLRDTNINNGFVAGQQIADYKWLRQFVNLFVVFQVIWLLHLVPYVIPATRDQLLNAVDWYPVYIPLAILIYVLGIRGYLQMQNRVAAVKKEASGTAFSAAFLDEATHSLCTAMESDKLYRNPALNLAALAKHTGLAPKTISAVLNQHLHKSFNEFINAYRIQEVKERLLQPQHQHLTIAGVAYECGFNSQPTFQRAFKAVVGLSPTEFIAKRA